MPKKRKFERFDINVPAWIEIIGHEGETKKYVYETCNLSAEGTCLKAGRMLQEGTKVRVEIFLKFDGLKCPANPDGLLIIAATGRVLRSGLEGTAIHFNNDYDIEACLDSHLEGEMRNQHIFHHRAVES
ncbi:MAG: hypothetical protein CSYNP_01100 [Syntrophus sp. SKADARSKE-3]|nr:hypothetical protein [Syntrophus sp. SKADARSKE-3]